MLQKYNRYKILEEFFNFPKKRFQIREISRRVKIALPSVAKHLKELEKEGLIIKENKGIYPSFIAKREEEKFKILKKTNMIIRVHETGLIKELYDLCVPDCIILFGSCAKGEDTEESDIDLFILFKEKKIELEKYEKLLNRRINLLFKENFNKLNNELKNNIINGIIIKGYLKVF